ncbi:DUF866-domain-containing protein [Cylindrobasidium torrendii FP15055 ss-10]|uniref:DUF866-domain-containing protein n=1 Tax=Cylindrobasidium torrendii FP15055 ss-10 TaxID=1314674 RepID=A0A0D7B4K1_9AGAR|nr:DUF866-domain-containing protein [Cylindrobasidium torrendii FP15055 ss-10]
MVVLQLWIKAELENVTDLQPATDDFEYFFKVKCTSCNEVHPKQVSVNRTEEYELASGKAKANFVWRCGMCKREHSASFNPAEKITPYNAENAQFGPLLKIECRGLEFIDFDPSGIWKVTGVGKGTKFNEVDLNEGEWTDYDEKAALPVGVSEVESKWTRA